MIERRRIIITPNPKANRVLQTWVESARALGYELATSYLGQRFLDLLVPVSDSAWRTELLKAVESGAVDDDWMEDGIIQTYSPKEMRTAPLYFPIHTGVDIQFPQGSDRKAGVCHLCTVDDSAACGECGAGVRQAGPIRLPASELNRCRVMASIWLGPNVIWMLTERVITDIEVACGVSVPRREVETTGSASTKEKWWQLVPEWSVPGDEIAEHRSARRVCGQCGAVWLDAGDDVPGMYFTASRSAWGDRLVPPIVRSPFWDGQLNRFENGRVIHFPEQAMWLRGDVARLLAARKIQGLDLCPIIWT